MNLIEALNAAAKSHGFTQMDIAKRISTSSAVVSRTMSGATIPSHTLLSALCAPSTWPDKETGLSILRAWLEDEIVRAGRSPAELEITMRGDNPIAREIEENLRLIRDWLPGNPDVQGIIGFLAETARNERKAAIEAAQKENKPIPTKATRADNVIPFALAPVPCYPIAAGKPITGDEDTVEIPAHLAADHFAVRVFGDSMEPEIKDGSIVIIMDREKLKRPMLKKGFIYTFTIDGQATLKRYNTRKATKKEIEAGKSYVSEVDGQTKVKVLESLNPAYPEIVLCPEDEPQMTGWYNPEVQL